MFYFIQSGNSTISRYENNPKKKAKKKKKKEWEQHVGIDIR